MFHEEHRHLAIANEDAKRCTDPQLVLCFVTSAMLIDNGVQWTARTAETS